MRAGNVSVGHPVDVASGAVYFRRIDVSIKGRLRMKWDRGYNSALRAHVSTPFGRGWSNRYYASLAESKDGFYFTTPEGDALTFNITRDRLLRGEIARDLATCQELAWSDGRLTVTRWDHPSRRVEKYVYIARESFAPLQLHAIESATGDSLDLVWDQEGSLAEIVQRLEGRRLVLSYTPKGKLESVLLIAKSGKRYRLADYGYTDAGDLTWARDAAGFEDHYSYDESGLLVNESLKSGGIFTFAYDKQGRCIKTEGLNGYDAKRLDYSAAIGLTEVIDSREHRNFYRWNERGQVVQHIDSMGAIRTTSYDYFGRTISKTDALGAISRFIYDDNGNCEQVVDAAGRVSATSFDPEHRPVTVKDPAGNIWKRTYDERGRLVMFTDPLNQSWKLKFDASGNLIELSDPNGASKKSRYSEAGELIASSDWDDHWTTYRLDDFGRVIEKTDPLGYQWRYSYTVRGELQEIQNPDRVKTKLTYDGAGNVTSVIEGGGGKTAMLYGTCRRLLKRTDPLGNSVEYQWGSEPGMLESVLNELGELHQFQYDAALHVKSEKTFDGRLLEYEYDSEGRCVAFRNGAGETIRYVRDPLGRVMEETLPDDSKSRFKYDLAGHLASAINEACEVRFERDALGRVLLESQGEHTIQKQFWAAGCRMSVATSFDLSAEYSFDNNDLVSQVKVQESEPISLQRDARGRETSRQFGRNLRLSYEYDGNGRSKAQLLGRAQSGMSFNVGRTLLSLENEYDTNGALISELRNGQETTTYNYDLAEHLQSVGKDDGQTEKFDFDPCGNVVALETADQSKEALQYEAGGRLSFFAKTKYIYDGQGRLVQRSSKTDSGSRPDSWRYEWNAKDQLTGVSDPTGKTWRYEYDALGRRVRKTGAQVATEYIWEGDRLIHEISGDKATVSWVYSPHSYCPIARLEGSSVHHIIADRLGKPVDVVDAVGELVWSASYSAYGRAKENGIRQFCPFRLPGQYFDSETGLHYNRFRYYDPEIGRYISPDPIGLRGGNNLYGYALNPINWLDPFGLAEEGCGSDEEEEDPPKKVWTSDDPHTADLANDIESAYPGHVVGVGTRPAGPTGTDLDIETQNAIIQIKSGNGAGLGRQITSSQQPDVNPDGKPVIGFAPNLGPHAAREVNNRGGIAAGGVASDRQTLIDVLKPDPAK